MKKIYTLLILISIFVSSFGQIPAGYYDNAAGKTGSDLKTALFNIISSHTAISYSGLWTAFETTDVDNYYEKDGTVLDIYSENPTGTDPYNFTFVTDQDDGTNVAEGVHYNREHSFPKNWFGGEVSPMYTDLFHIYPTDKVVNNKRSNYPYGEVSNPSWTSENGSKLGPCSYPGYTGTVFEPIDEFKGDLARTYFYMVTCYEDKITNWSSVILDGKTYPGYTSWFLSMLLKWNAEDPVSQKEIDRNNEIYKNYQHNRNPYIDHPEYVNKVFDPSNAISEHIESQVVIYPNPVTNSSITISTNNLHKKIVVIYNIEGKILDSENFSQRNEKIDLSNFRTGIYFMKITTDNSTCQKKIIVE